MPKSKLPPTVHELRSSSENRGEARPAEESGRALRTHRERVRVSLAWALDEYAVTLAKLAK